jgi:hypothetical protein
MDEWMHEWMTEDLARLRSFTHNCREDMHEPDEQDLSARVVGDHLDNACGTSVAEDAIVRGYQEYVVVLKNHEGRHERFNLACLVALARKAMIGPVDER